VGEEEKSNLYKAIAFWMVISMGGSTAISTGVQKLDTNTRADPFTGTQGKELSKRIRALERAYDKDVSHMLEFVDDMHEHIEEHNKESESWKRRIIWNERRLDALEQRLGAL